MKTAGLIPSLTLPLRLIPGSLHSAIFARGLNRLLSDQRAQGELDFLERKILCIEVEDAALSYSISLGNGVLTASNSAEPDLIISGKVFDFLQMMARVEDADTLFFQRRLKMQGDTELGLYLKNFLDGLDVDALPFYRLGKPLLLNGIRLLEAIGQQEITGDRVRGV